MAYYARLLTDETWVRVPQGLPERKIMSALKDRVSKGKVVKFIRFQNNELWYQCEDGFEFPIHVSDTGNAEFKNQDAALFFMRWIRKHMEMIEQARNG